MTRLGQTQHFSHAQIKLNVLCKHTLNNFLAFLLFEQVHENQNVMIMMRRCALSGIVFTEDPVAMCRKAL